MQLSTLLALFTFLPLGLSQSISDSDGYTGYTLSVRDDSDPDSVVYETENTDTSNGATYSTPPDVYLNASVSVGEIDLLVRNLTAKITLDAQVLSLLQFSAGVDVSISRVNLQIQNVSAKVILEARLENLVAMIDTTLSSIDLNPAIATLGQDLGSVVDDTVGGLASTSTAAAAAAPASSTLNARSYDMEHNVLFSVNNYQGNTHTNRILTRSGDIVDQSLHNDGSVYAESTVGSYWHDMTPTGHEHSVVFDGQMVRELEYEYSPYAGLMVVSAIYVDAQGSVVGTRVLSESGGGGSSTIGNDSDDELR